MTRIDEDALLERFAPTTRARDVRRSTTVQAVADVILDGFTQGRGPRETASAIVTIVETVTIAAVENELCQRAAETTGPPQKLAGWLKVQLRKIAVEWAAG